MPSAHTCFNVLLLPLYKKKETIKEKLMISLENAEGFGLMWIYRNINWFKIVLNSYYVIFFFLNTGT